MMNADEMITARAMVAVKFVTDLEPKLLGLEPGIDPTKPPWTFRAAMRTQDRQERVEAFA